VNSRRHLDTADAGETKGKTFFTCGPFTRIINCMHYFIESPLGDIEYESGMLGKLQVDDFQDEQDENKVGEGEKALERPQSGTS
jgi:hypothetical protein